MSGNSGMATSLHVAAALWQTLAMAASILGFANLMHHASTKRACRFHSCCPVRAFSDAFSTLRDVDLCAVNAPFSGCPLAWADPRIVVGELYCLFPPRLSLYQCWC